MGSLLQLLEEERAARQACQRQLGVMRSELQLAQKKHGDLGKQLDEERRSHEYFKNRLATCKGKHAALQDELQAARASCEEYVAELDLLKLEKEEWLADKQALLAQQDAMSQQIERATGKLKLGASARTALLSALDQEQREKDDTKQKLRTMEQQQRVPECVVCFEAEVGMVFAPCGHVCVCPKCGELEECPLCRRSVDTKIKLHFA